MIEERVVLRREDFLDLREARNHPQKTSGIITAVNYGGVIYSSGVFPRSSQISFINALESIDCYEILGDFNSIIIPYTCGDSKDVFAEMLEIYQQSTGILDEFCFVKEKETKIHTPIKEFGIISFPIVPYGIAGEKRIDPDLFQFLREQNQALSNYLGSCSCTVEHH